MAAASSVVSGVGVIGFDDRRILGRRWDGGLVAGAVSEETRTQQRRAWVKRSVSSGRKEKEEERGWREPLFYWRTVDLHVKP